ncbi:MAG: Nramp family divalent metal transporter [Candidatus Marinimicrobia bacterium]|nr:Nramp family divalent metal transporter [Candidatus Neomarinimicrobiota bacterium]
MKNTNYQNIQKTIGPGILFAGAAIGGSHLIQSTRAGADYGFDLLTIVILINLFKYPFFEFGHRYTAVTGESILNGYAKLGKSTLWIFLIMNIFTSVINGAAVTLVTAGLCANLFSIMLSPAIISLLVLIVITAILFIGRYAMLDMVMKIMIAILAITTIITVFIALGIDTGSANQNLVSKPDLWNAAGIAFLLALMGWMPAPIEISVWPSLWALERSKQTHYRPSVKEALIDFHIGYIGTTLIALFFVGLGAFVMFGSGEKFSNSSVVFSSQLVSLYTKTIGEWSRIIIGSIVFITMLSTTLTVFDAYPRTLAGSMQLLSVRRFKPGKYLYHFWAIFMIIAGFMIIACFTSGIKTLMDFATIVAFLAAPVFAIINYRVVTAPFMPEEYRPQKWLRILSWAGMIFLVTFSLIYILSLVL